MKVSPQDMAIRMLCGDPHTDRLQDDLYFAIDNVEMLVGRLGGELRSRQVIAGIIVAWSLANPGKSALKL